MLRSMFTAISALNLHQYWMDVVSDNLANANTPSFKSRRVTFQDQFAQILWNGSAPSGDLGGVNPAQVGLGVRMGAISPDFTQGMLQSTGRNTDLAVQGDGFFIYSDGANQYYSRDGALEIDAEGYLVNGATGQRIQGWQAVQSGGSPTINTGLPIGAIQLPLGSTLARPTSKAMLTGNLDATTDDPAATYDVTIGVYDSLGQLHSATLTFSRPDPTANDWNWSASGTGVSGSGSVSFNDDGQYASGGGSITIAATNGAQDLTFDLDMTGLTQLATDNDVSIGSQDGLAAGSFTGFFVSPETGEIYGLYSNGMQEMLGQLALANFVNPSGLTRLGQNLYQVGINSGEPSIGTSNTGGRGSVASGYLEASNVDLAQEFTNMILAQRGFQASSRVISASDEILQELVNIKR